MRNFKEYITEGVYDPNIFKAVFLAGGPGSGKSWVSTRALGGMGLKVINSDSMFARALSKEGMGLDFSKYSVSNSQPIPSLSVLLQAIAVEPEPIKISKTVSFGLV